MPRPVDHSCSPAHERHHFDAAEPVKPKAVKTKADDTDEDDEDDDTQAEAGKDGQLYVVVAPTLSLTDLSCALVGMSNARQDVVLEISVDEHHHGHIEVRSSIERARD